MTFNTNYKAIIRGQDDFNSVVNILAHNGIIYIPNDFMTCIFHIYTTDKDVYIECTTDNGRLTVSSNGQYYIQIDAADMEVLSFGQLRWKLTYEILHNKQPNHVLEGTEYGGVDTYLVSEIINN
jgi:hypothetical protein